MACKIIYNGNKTPIGVKTTEGNPSKMFDEILSNPHISTFNQALDIYIQAPKEDKIQYHTKSGEVFNTFKEAVKATNGEIAMKVDGKVIASINGSTDTSSVSGNINYLLKNNMITESSYIDENGNNILVVEGFDAKKIINSEAIKEELKRNLGLKAVTFFESGDFHFNEDNLRTKIKLTNSKNEVEVIDRDELFNKPFNDIVKYDEGLTAIVAREYNANTPVFQKSLEKEVDYIPEDELQTKLLSILKNFGIKTMSISEYVTKYKIKNGVEPSAQALVDLANLVVAFKDGVVTTSALSEEVSHLIVASLSEVEKVDMLRNVHKTQQWLRYADHYMNIYGSEDMVREEILGKVLAEAFIDSFSTEKSATLSEKSIIEKLQELFNNFIEKVKNYFTPDYQKQLNTFTTNVYQNLVNETIQLDIDNIKNKRFTLYSSDSSDNTELNKLQIKLESLLNSLNAQLNELSKKYNQQGDREILRKAKEQLTNKLDDITAQSAIIDLSRVAVSQISTLNKVVDEQKEDYHFSQEEKSVFINLEKNTIPILRQILPLVKEKTTKKQIEDIIIDFNTLQGKIPDNNRKSINTMLDSIVSKFNLTSEQEQKYREEMRIIMEQSQKDTNWLHAHIGSLLHARNGLLNLAGDVTERTQVDARLNFNSAIKDFLNNVGKFDVTKLNKLIYNGEIINEKDSELVEKVNRQDKAKAFNIATSTSEFNEENIETKIKNLQDNIEEGDNAKILREGLEIYYDIVGNRYVPYYKDDYKELLDSFEVDIDGGLKLSKISVSKKAVDIHNFYRNQISQIKKNAKDGVLTEQDNIQIRKLVKQRMNETNIRNIDGSFKNGLSEYYDSTLKRFVPLLDLSVVKNEKERKDALKIYGMNIITIVDNEFYKQNPIAKKTTSDKFYDILNSLETEKEKWEFVKNNASITFSDEFWSNFNIDETIVNRLMNDGKTEIAEEIRKRQQIIANILKQNREYNEPTEISTNEEYGIVELEKKIINNAVSELQSLFRNARQLLGDKVEEGDITPFTTNTNKAYKKDLENSGKNELDFIKDNTTIEDKTKIDRLLVVANKLKNGESVEFKSLEKKVFSKLMDEKEIDNALLEYGKSRLLPYYKRTEPNGYGEILNALEEGVKENKINTVKSFMNNDIISVSPNFVFFDLSEDNINPDWLANKKAGREQYTQEYLDRVANKEYYTLFGVNDKGEATKNLELFQARKALLELNDTALEWLGLTGIHNRYQLPQTHKDNIRRITTSKDKKKALKEVLLDMVSVREDDLDYGQNMDGSVAKKGSSLLTVPMYGVRKLENKDDVSDELMYSYAWFAQQASLYRARKNNIGDMFAIEDMLLRDNAVEGIESHTSMTYKMFKSFLNANFYGVKDTFSSEVSIPLTNKKIDLGKLARTFHKYVRFSNLAGITVPITSMVQGKIQELTEKLVTEIVDPIAYMEAQKFLFKHGSDAAKEVMGFNSKADLNVYGEFTGMYNPMDRYEHSGYGKASRVALKINSGIHQIGNFPVTTTTNMAILFDYRWVGNTIMTKKQYSRNFPNATDTEWKSFDLFINDMPVENGKVEFDIESISKKTGLDKDSQEIKDWIKLKSEAISVRALDAIQRIDSQIPEHQKSLAARDARANFFLMHINWFLNAWQQKTKSRHFNLSTGAYQEGSWITTAKLVGNMMTHPKKMVEIYKTAMKDETTRLNARRTLVELSIGNAIAIMALLLAKANDDDDEVPFMLAYTDYILTRVANEQVSATIGLPNQIGNMLSDPLLPATRAKDLIFDSPDMFSGDIVSRGVYAGETERYRYLSKNFPLLKEYNRLGDPIRARQTYAYFNFKEEKMLSRYAWLTWLLEDKNK